MEKVYSYDGPLPEDLAPDARIKSLRNKVEQEQKAFDKPKGDGPDTLVELTGRAVSASRQRWRNARGALGGSSEPADQSLPEEPLSPDETPAPLDPGAASATVPDATEANAGERPGLARRSYRCVVSLFRNCRGEGSGQGQ